MPPADVFLRDVVTALEDTLSNALDVRLNGIQSNIVKADLEPGCLGSPHHSQRLVAAQRRLENKRLPGVDHLVNLHESRSTSLDFGRSVIGGRHRFGDLVRVDPNTLELQLREGGSFAGAVRPCEEDTRQLGHGAIATSR